MAAQFKTFYRSHSKIKKVLFACLCLFPIFLPGYDLIFHSERLEFEIFPDHCNVTGYYIFRNDNPDLLQQTLIYPFPVQEGFPFPSSLSITDSCDTPLSYERGANEILFPVIVPGESCTTFKVHYSQPTPEHFMEYILNTTMQWHFPLASAEFSIIVPNDITIESISMPGYEISKENGKTRYRIYKENFRTKKNLIIRWRIK